ncbi:hypothetical protein BD779DRAFT_1670497 [Infundibulicybe gibba]|nr:hypothetical protein BD779DRAFT_1670497 [Infundibulicybe gibba]
MATDGRWLSRHNVLENVGSTARDFCMLERNLLSHLKLALLLSLLSSSVLLRARLVPEPTHDPSRNDGSQAGIPLAAVQFLASLVAIAAGAWEYNSGYRDLRNMRAFLVAVRPHMAVMSLVAGVIFSTCIVLLAEENQL